MGKSLSGRELGKGISQRSDGRYQARFTDSYGRRHTVYANTINEIKRVFAEAKTKKYTPTGITEDITLEQWFDVWLTTYKVHCRSTTLRNYRNLFAPIRVSLGCKRLVDIKTVDLQMVFNQMSGDACRRNAKALLSDMFKRAIESELVVKNPSLTLLVNINHDQPTEKRIVSDRDMELLLSVMPAWSYNRRFVIIAHDTGMRVGEILGLCWENVDWQQKLIHVKTTLAALPAGNRTIYELHPPKTKAGYRSIPMTQAVYDALVEQRMYKTNIETKHTPLTGFENLVFVSRTNHPIHQSTMIQNLSHYCNAVRKANPDIDYPPITPHCFRHTFATNCIARGMKPKVLQMLLGHTSLKMTMDLYCHVEPETIRNEMMRVSILA